MDVRAWKQQQQEQQEQRAARQQQRRGGKAPQAPTSPAVLLNVLQVYARAGYKHSQLAAQAVRHLTPAALQALTPAQVAALVRAVMALEVRRVASRCLLSRSAQLWAHVQDVLGVGRRHWAAWAGRWGTRHAAGGAVAVGAGVGGRCFGGQVMPGVLVGAAALAQEVSAAVGRCGTPGAGWAGVVCRRGSKVPRSPHPSTELARERAYTRTAHCAGAPQALDQVMAGSLARWLQQQRSALSSWPCEVAAVAWAISHVSARVCAGKGGWGERRRA